MLLRKAYRFRIYPDATQEELFRRTIGCCRLVYNLCLDQRLLERERSKPRKLSQFDQIKELTGLKEEFEFLYEVPHHPLVQAVMDLHKAFANFFEGRAGFPTFRGKGQNDSFRYPDPKQIKFDLSQEGLAARAGMSLGSLKRFERTGQIAFESLIRLAFALGAETEFDALFPRAKYTSIDDVLRQPRTRKRGTVK
jgi:transposase